MLTTAHDAKRMAEQASIVVEMISKYYPEATQSKKGSNDLAIPVV